MSYAKHKSDWEKYQADTLKIMAKMREPHHVTGRDLMRELSLLARITGDKRFSDAQEALKDNFLTDEKNSWVRKWSKTTPHDPTPQLIEFIDEKIAQGRSLREVCAYVVADGILMHATFEAGVAYVERIWRRAKASQLDIE